MSERVREYIIPISITVLLLTISFILHFKSCGSPLSYSNELSQQRMNLHLTYYPFSIRYLTTYPTLYLHQLTGLSIKASFFTLQFFIAFLIGPVFYNYLKILKFDRNWSNVGVFLLFSCYPIIAAHFEPVHTWDDFWVYIFLILTFSHTVKGNPISSGIYFALACFGREQSLMFYPVLIFSFFLFGDNIKLSRKIIGLLIPVITFGGFYINVMKVTDPIRFKYILYNFEHALRARDALFSFYISFGFIWLAAGMALLFLRHIKKDKIQNLLYYGALYSAPVTILLTFFITKARETRIFFPPFVFLIPLALLILIPLWRFIKEHFTVRSKYIILSTMILVTTGTILFAWIMLPRFEYRQCVNFCREWAGVNLSLIIFIAGFYLIYPKIKDLFNSRLDHSFSDDSSSSRSASV